MRGERKLCAIWRWETAKKQSASRRGSLWAQGWQRHFETVFPKSEERPKMRYAAMMDRGVCPAKRPHPGILERAGSAHPARSETGKKKAGEPKRNPVPKTTGKERRKKLWRN